VAKKSVKTRKKRTKSLDGSVKPDRKTCKPVGKRRKRVRPKVNDYLRQEDGFKYDFPVRDFQLDIHPQIGIEEISQGSMRYAWIGSGQCGGRLMKTFYDLRYGKVLAINTAANDLELLDIPESQKILLKCGTNGAGKDMKRGAKAVHHCREEIMVAAERVFGNQIDHVMVCFGAGGGTGSGSAMGLIELAKEYVQRIGMKKSNKNVGVMMTLPTESEVRSGLVAQNAYTIASELAQMASQGQISPLIIIDNAKISSLYPAMTVRAFWPTVNNAVGELFDIFNRLSALPSIYTCFDPTDYHSIMTAGGCAVMGVTELNGFRDKEAIISAIKKNLNRTLLAGGFRFSGAKIAGSIIVGSRKLMANETGLQKDIDNIYDALAEITGNATIHRGIYEDYRESLRVYTIIGGLKAPTRRLNQLQNQN